MTTEWGALTGLFPVDDKTIQWYADRLERWHRRKASKATATARSPLERVTEADLRYVMEKGPLFKFGSPLHFQCLTHLFSHLRLFL